MVHLCQCNYVNIRKNYILGNIYVFPSVWISHINGGAGPPNKAIFLSDIRSV